MRKLVLIALSTMLGFTSANARTFTIKATTNTGPTSVKSVMDSVEAGDIVYVNDGTYPATHPPGPKVTGTVDARITIIGNLTHPENVVMASPHLPYVPALDGGTDWAQTTIGYTTWKGINFTEDFSIGMAPCFAWRHSLADPTCVDKRAVADSVIKCYLNRGFQINGGTYSGITDSKIGYNYVDPGVGINNANIEIVGNTGWGDAYQAGPGCFVTDCTFNLYVNTTDHASTAIGLKGSQYDDGNNDGNYKNGLLRDVMFARNRGTIKYIGDNSAGGTFGVTIYGNAHATIQDCRFEIQDSTGQDNKDNLYAVYQRDHLDSCMWVRDTIVCTNGNQLIAAIAPGGGNYPSYRTTYTDCIWDMQTTKSPSGRHPALFFKYQIEEFAWTRCVFNIPDGEYINFGGQIAGTNWFQNCTFRTKDSPLGCIRFDDLSDGSNAEWPAGTAISLRSCIFYNNTTQNYPALYVKKYNSAILSLGYNLYTTYGTGADLNARPLCILPVGVSPNAQVEKVGGTCYYPGDALGTDQHSIYGSPQFVDSTQATFDWDVDGASVAQNAGEFGTTIGAHQTTADNTRPAQLVLTGSPIGLSGYRVSWTDVGDDSLTGTATAYDMRYVLGDDIDDSNWDTFGVAIPITGVNDQMVPSVAGTTRQIILSGLMDHAEGFHIAMKVRDEVGHWSAISASVGHSSD